MHCKDTILRTQNNWPYSKLIPNSGKSLKQDLTILAAELMQNPDMGTDLGNGLHKVRMSIASKGKGKRGGARVITLIATLSKEEKEIGLHFIYDKSERENITDKELQAVLKDNGII